MASEAYSFALRNTLNEIRNVCSDVSSIFIFRTDRKIIIGDEGTSEKAIMRVLDAFDGVLERATTAGGLESVTIKYNNGRVNVSCVNDYHLVTVLSKQADERYVSITTRILVPTVLKLLEKIHPTLPESNASAPETKEPEPDFPTTEELEREDKSVTETLKKETENTGETEVKVEPVLQEPPANQFLVENLSGLFVPSDTVRIDSNVIAQWKELCSDKSIEEVEVETFNGKATQCKFKPIKDLKYEGQGVVQIPEKIQVALEIKKGDLVKVKPIVK